MTENEVLEMLLEIKEIQVDRFEVQDQHLHIYCSSVFQPDFRSFFCKQLIFMGINFASTRGRST